MKISKYDQSHESVGLKFWQVHMLWSRKIRNSLDQLGITHTQFVVLASILEIKESQIENEVTQKMISKFSNIDVMTISSVMRLLLEKENFMKILNKLSEINQD